ncbi:MAG: flagellar basal body-associated FliL family protein [Myxococcota bacterium]|nr:flagellar basal body-associated FliL family protein [Myxococcales bacterium]
MAKNKDKEEAKEPAQESSGGGKGGLAIIIAAALISLGLGAGGAFLFASSQAPPPQPVVTQEAAAEMMDEKAAAKQRQVTEDFKERLYGLDPFVVNVTGDGYNRFLKLRVELETNDVKLKEEIDARLPQVRDALIVLLSSKQLSDITDFEGKALLKEDILERVNDLLETGNVRSVLFTEFVVQ